MAKGKSDLCRHTPGAVLPSKGCICKRFETCFGFAFKPLFSEPVGADCGFLFGLLWDQKFAMTPTRVFYSKVYLYVYVVAVNKGTPLLWTTPVYRKKSSF
jgi:hypothetical protein